MSSNGSQASHAALVSSDDVACEAMKYFSRHAPLKGPAARSADWAADFLEKLPGHVERSIAEALAMTGQKHRVESFVDNVRFDVVRLVADGIAPAFPRAPVFALEAVQMTPPDSADLVLILATKLKQAGTPALPIPHGDATLSFERQLRPLLAQLGTAGGAASLVVVERLRALLTASWGSAFLTVDLNEIRFPASPVSVLANIFAAAEQSVSLRNALQLNRATIEATKGPRTNHEMTTIGGALALLEQSMRMAESLARPPAPPAAPARETPRVPNPVPAAKENTANATETRAATAAATAAAAAANAHPSVAHFTPSHFAPLSSAPAHSAPVHFAHSAPLSVAPEAAAAQAAAAQTAAAAQAAAAAAPPSFSLAPPLFSLAPPAASALHPKGAAAPHAASAPHAAPAYLLQTTTSPATMHALNPAKDMGWSLSTTFVVCADVSKEKPGSAFSCRGLSSGLDLFCLVRPSNKRLGSHLIFVAGQTFQATIRMQLFNRSVSNRFIVDDAHLPTEAAHASTARAGSASSSSSRAPRTERWRAAAAAAAAAVPQ
jgi:hypothetical protein